MEWYGIQVRSTLTSFIFLPKLMAIEKKEKEMLKYTDTGTHTMWMSTRFDLMLFRKKPTNRPISQRMKVELN